MKKRYFNKWLVIILIFALVASNSFNGNMNRVRAAQTGTVTATTLNVRTEPSTTATKIQMNGTNVYLSKGDTVEILDENGDFYQVTLKFNGKTVKGYVHKDFVKLTSSSVAPTVKPTVKPTPTQTPSPTKKLTPTPKVTPTPKPTSSASIKKEVQIAATITASTLNIRSGPGTSFSKVSGLVKGNKVTVINETMAADKTEWYGISFKVGGKTLTGYATSEYIKLNYGRGIKGEISASKINVKSKASSKAASLKYKSGSIVSLKKDKAVTLLAETTVSGVKWLKISFTVSKVKYVGYVEAKNVTFIPTVSVPTATPTPTKAPTKAPTKTPTLTVAPTKSPTVAPTKTPTISLSPTKKPTPTPTKSPTVAPTPTNKPTVAPSKAPTMTPTPTIAPTLFEVADLTVKTDIYQPINGYVCNVASTNIVRNVLMSNELLVDGSGQPIVLVNSQKVLVTGLVYVNNKPWYNISTASELYGYVEANYIYIGDKIPTGNAITPTRAPSVTSTPTPTPVNTNNFSFIEKLRYEGFPESYIPALVQLHTIYPSWEFKAYKTGLEWNTVISKESIPGKNLIPNSRSVEWKSLESGAYNWKTDMFTVYDGTTWVTASKAAIEYYMDPRNYLTASGIFQFELLKYQSAYQNEYGVENILKGTALYNNIYSFTDEFGVLKNYSYALTFIRAAEYSGVSPYHLASRVKQEVVTGSTTLSGSVTGKYPGYEGYYNFYNIGASDSAGGGAIANGLRYAKNGSSNTVNNSIYMIPWTNPYRSIVGGSYFIGGSYINRGQDTIYLQKFNVTPNSTYYHQYMSNVEAPFAEAKKVLTAYNGMADSPIVFSIPVYLNMPASAAPRPITMYNPNNRMSSLKVLDAVGNELAITPTFSQTELNYYLMVDNKISSVQIKATTVSKKATVMGNGTVAINVGTNEIFVPVIAENGDMANYKVTIIRAE